MRGSTKNRIAGTFHELKGTAKMAMGRATKNRRTTLAGRVEKTAGVIQAKFGKVTRKLGR